MHQLRAHAPTVFLLLLALWLWWPALGAVPVEGFGAMLVSVARGWQTGTLALVDAAYPFDTEFYLLTRFGMSSAIALFPVAGLDGNLIFAIITGLGFAVSAVMGFLFVRQWTDAPPASVLFALIVLPGFAESAFFLHENMLALAFFTSAMVLIGWRQKLWAAAAAGGLLGLALLTRSDFILLAPALPLILWARFETLNRLLLATVVGIATTVATFWVPLLAVGITPLDLIAVINHSVTLWARDPLLEIPLRMAFLFAGAAGLLLLPFGVISAARNATWPVRLLLLGVPLLFLLIYGSKLWQARQFLPIFPFVLALVAMGGNTLWRLMPSLPGRTVACLLLAFLWLSPGPIVFFDGPRMLTGQFWSPLVWRDWQNQVADQLAIIDAEVDGLANGGVLVTDDWTMDRYTHLAFRENGWTPAIASTCRPYVEVWQKAGRIAYHARISIPFVVGPERAMPALFDDFVGACLPSIGAPVLHHLAVIESSPSPDMPAFLQTPPYWAVEVTTLDQPAMAELLRIYREEAGDRASTMDRIDAETETLQGITSLLQ